MNQVSRKVVRFTAWSALIGGLFAYANVGLSLAVTGSDTGMILHGASMLSLPADTRDLFRWCMVVDILGFYLPFVAIGGYFLHAFRDALGAFSQMLGLAIGLYIMVGIAGAAMQLGILDPLARAYAGRDEATKGAAATAWSTIAYATQNGLWWCEGPLVFFWAPIAANLLGQAGWRGSILLKIVGWSFGCIFLFGLFPGLNVLSDASELIAVLVLPLWMLLFGWQVLRRSPACAEPSAGFAT